MTVSQADAQVLATTPHATASLLTDVGYAVTIELAKVTAGQLIDMLITLPARAVVATAVTEWDSRCGELLTLTFA